MILVSHSFWTAILMQFASSQKLELRVHEQVPAFDKRHHCGDFYEFKCLPDKIPTYAKIEGYYSASTWHDVIAFSDMLPVLSR